VFDGVTPRRAPDLDVGALQRALRQAALEPARQLKHHLDEHDDLARPADRARDPRGVHRQRPI
jgi:hypothetical protein